MLKKIKSLKLLVVLFIILVISFFIWQSSKPKAEQPQYITEAVTKGDLESTVLATGTLSASKMLSVGAQVSGQVKHMYVHLGDQVKTGQVIAKIDSETQENTLQNTAANIRSLQAQHLQQDAKLHEATLEYNRQKAMLAQNATPRASFEAAEANYKTASAQIKVLDAQIEQARLSESTARTNVGYTRIIAPIDGTVVAIVTDEGQTVNSNQTTPTIVKLAQLGQMTVKAQVSEADVMKIAKGQQVYFTTLGDDQKRYATLRQIEPAPDSIASDSSSTNSAVYYNALFDVPNLDGKLRINMTAQVYIVLNSVKDAVLVPSSALSSSKIVLSSNGMASANQQNTSPQARKLNLTNEQKELIKDGKASLNCVRIYDGGDVYPQQVLVGINNRVNAQVLAGLKEGQQVVIADSNDASAADAKSNNSRKRNGPPMGM
ncbi:hypothetical protein P256_01350 [Acinetobacter nectaris CIP 110549]|uniref:Uncharacterized protein n=1 Tax=Acinetobacter nectaris CIP 110549 TaxID=1392540 RepID=V2TAH0_9GAMM|nr:efflux RND transporter periplasmic adaptor subunit [Acinetobacter nectaris]ESK39668.1 hypothetical protein P256_01350 [Acinetobacter nectaris CIP 110549]